LANKVTAFRTFVAPKPSIWCIFTNLVHFCNIFWIHGPGNIVGIFLIHKKWTAEPSKPPKKAGYKLLVFLYKKYFSRKFYRKNSKE
jgi:hypothetical protein